MSKKGALSKVKNVVWRYQPIISCLIIIVLFLVGYKVSDEFIMKPHTNEELKYCEEVAKTIYEQRDEYIIEIPEDIVFTKTDTSINVHKRWRSGEIIATLENGELVYERNSHMGTRIFINFCLGALFMLVTILIVRIILKLDSIYRNN